MPASTITGVLRLLEVEARLRQAVLQMAVAARTNGMNKLFAKMKKRKNKLLFRW